MRFTLLPDPRFRKHFSGLTDRLDRAAKLVTRETFNDFADDLMTTILGDSFAVAGADEGTLWLLDPAKRQLDAVFNTGSTAAKVTKLSQTLDRGLISMVFSTGQPFCENDMSQNPEHDKTFDLQVGSPTTAMIAVILFSQECRGIVSCVIGKDHTGTRLVSKRFRHGIHEGSQWGGCAANTPF